MTNPIIRAADNHPLIARFVTDLPQEIGDYWF